MEHKDEDEVWTLRQCNLEWTKVTKDAFILAWVEFKRFSSVWVRTAIKRCGPLSLLMQLASHAYSWFDGQPRYCGQGFWTVWSVSQNWRSAYVNVMCTYIDCHMEKSRERFRLWKLWSKPRLCANSINEYVLKFMLVESGNVLKSGCQFHGNPYTFLMHTPDLHRSTQFRDNCLFKTNPMLQFPYDRVSLPLKEWKSNVGRFPLCKIQISRQIDWQNGLVAAYCYLERLNRLDSMEVEFV